MRRTFCKIVCRFILLEDCDHVIEGRLIELSVLCWSKSGAEISWKLCPICKTPITNTLRYRNALKVMYQHLANIKGTVRGTDTERSTKTKRLARKLEMLNYKMGPLFCKLGKSWGKRESKNGSC